MSSRLLPVCLLAGLTSSALADSAQESPKSAAPRRAAQKALADLQEFVGQWRGVGQPQRGSTAGAWQEEADWAWDFNDDQAQIVFHAPKGKYFVRGTILPGQQPGQFRLVAELPDEKGHETFSGGWDQRGRLVFRAQEPADGRPAELVLQLVAQGKRMTVLYQRQIPGTDRLVRLAEVGYTRKGSGFGRTATQPECIVTGGAALIAVNYQGKTYYVCCTGCRDYFLENPEEVLAEYAQRLAERRQNDD